MKKFDIKSNYIYILMIVVAIGITISGISFSIGWKIAPLYVSLFVMLLNSKANRYGLLVGSINSLVYAAVYYYYNLLGTTFSALLISFPIQLVSFILWSKKSYKETTMFRKMSGKGLTWLVIGIVLSYIGVVYVLKKMGGSFVYFDSLSFLFGLVVPILTMLAFVEYPVFNLISSINSVILHAVMIPTVPEQTTYLIFSLYSLVCIILMRKKVSTFYKEQVSEK